MAINPESKYLSERLIARLPAYRRSNLERRLREGLEQIAECVESGCAESKEGGCYIDYRAYRRRLTAILGRLLAMTA